MTEDTNEDLSGGAEPLSEDEQQRIAIEKLLSLFAESGSLGVSDEKMTIVALSATLNQMVVLFGEEKTAAIMETVPAKILDGHFTTKPAGAIQ